VLFLFWCVFDLFCFYLKFKKTKKKIVFKLRRFLYKKDGSVMF